MAVAREPAVDAARRRVEIERVPALVVRVPRRRSKVAAVAGARLVAMVEVALLRHRSEAAVHVQANAGAARRRTHAHERARGVHLDVLAVDGGQTDREGLAVAVAGRAMTRLRRLEVREIESIGRHLGRRELRFLIEER